MLRPSSFVLRFIPHPSSLIPYNPPRMAIIMSQPFTAQEMRVLQEYRRINSQTMSLDAIKAIKHPAGGDGRTPEADLRIPKGKVL